MADMKPTRDARVYSTAVVEQCPLSGFETRCLLKRICDCHEVIQLAILGAGSANAKAGGLTAVCDALKAAELVITLAEELAAQRLH